MPRILLIHPRPAEVAQAVRHLRELGYTVVRGGLPGPALLRQARRPALDAILIDLSRLPSQGRDVGAALRQQRSTRHLPLLFLGGAADKVAGVRRILPDAAFAAWSRVGSALKRLLARPPGDPVVPASSLAGYSGTPLPKKLGIRPTSTLGLFGAPTGFRHALGGLPAGTIVRQRPRTPTDVTLWFVRRRSDVIKGMPAMARRASGGRLWICWPKQGSPLAADVTQNDVRRLGLAAGLVDYKIAAIDDDWSGLCFAARKR
jgi:CheY-like chemotaxis protein